MSGCIFFSQSRGWCKAGWAYRAALDGICEALTHMSGGDELARELTDEAGPARSVENIEVAEWSQEKQQLFRRAVLEACGILRARGPKDWHDRSFFPGFLKTLAELDAIATDEKRANKAPEPTSGSVTPPATESTSK
jgi:hypothetical protein